jgi:hypothetical protein
MYYWLKNDPMSIFTFYSVPLHDNKQTIISFNAHWIVLSILIGCSGWSYSDSFERGGWIKVFYPDIQTKKLPYYAQFFNTAEMDATFYEKFYMYMTKGKSFYYSLTNTLIG